MKNKHSGFTLIELMIAILIFAIISVISYRIISSLLITKQVVTNAQNKWGSLAQAINRMGTTMDRCIPLVIRDANGVILPALITKPKLSSNFDAQLELTTSGNIGDPIYGTTAPKRVGFRYINQNLYLITWPVLNRVLTTNPRVDLLLTNIKTFNVQILYNDKQWRDTWPIDDIGISSLPIGVKVEIEMLSGEKIMRQWAL